MNNNAITRKALKSGAWYTIANFLVRSIGFLTTPIFGRLLTKAEFGVVNHYGSWLSIFTIIITLNLESTFISARFDHKKTFDDYVYSVLVLSSISSLFWILVLNVLNFCFPSILQLDSFYLNAMMVYILFLPAINMYQTRERYLFEYKHSVLVSVVVAVGTSVLSVVLVLLSKDKLTARIIGGVIPSVIVGIVLFALIVKRSRKLNFDYWKYALPICLPFIPHLLSLVLLNQMDRIMIRQICGVEDEGVYSMASNCGLIIMILVTSLNSAFSPWLGGKLDSKEFVDIRRFTKKYILLFVIVSFGFVLVAPEILFIFGDKPYMEAQYVIPPVALGCILQFLYIFFVDVEQFYKHTLGMAIASMIAALTNYALNAFLIPMYGYIAAAYTTVAGYLVLLAIHMFLVYRLKMSHIYSYPFVILVVLVCSIVTIAISILYACDNIYRYAAILLYLFACLIVANKYKAEIKTMVKMIKQKH